MILIGSRALAFWVDHNVEGKDWDIVADHAEAEYYTGRKLDPEASSWNHGNIEFHNAAYSNNIDIEFIYWSDRYVQVPGLPDRVEVCSARGLAAIKRSHLHRHLKFTNHMIQYLKLEHNFSELDWAFIQERKEFTLKAFPDAFNPFEITNEDFFDDAVTRIVDHDLIHEIIAPNGVPIFLSLKSDHTMAGYDPKLWEAASHEVKIQAIREECYAIAIERWLLPHAVKGEKYPYRFAFTRAVEKCCTILDVGPLREYTIDHWEEINQFDPSVFDKFFESELYHGIS